jgi:hypothetical protein
MSGPPDNILQFRNPPRKDEPYVYMGGTTIGCGDHPTTPKRHRWGRWRVSGSGKSRYRMCNTCGLCSDSEYFEEGKWRAADWEPAA